MEQSFKTRSLLPWLNHGSDKIHLHISVQEKSAASQTPFLLLNRQSPLFRLTHASYQTPAGKAVKDIFLLVQNDHCSFFEKNSHFTNSEIDKIWQEALASGGSAREADFFDSLAAPAADQTDFPLWQSLFYCKKQQCYFHPPCPECGNFLELCQQDEILAVAELPPYSSSLERFLFCPVCHQSQTETAFFSHGGDDIYSTKAKNLQDLIDGFGQLTKNKGQNDNFPCSTCTEQAECYGSLAPSRITPFAFYPFRMVVTDAGQLPAADFLTIISGAPWAEIKTLPHIFKDAERVNGKEGIKLFFADDKRKFIEIFYLKIALLEQITRAALAAGKNLKHMDLRLCMDQFWVNFPDHEGLLPLFWNFHVRPIALGIFPSEDISSVRLPESMTLHSLALLWFDALLVNKEQSTTMVQQALAHLDDNQNQQDEPDFLSSTVNDGGVFRPENIFWLADQKELDQSWLVLWNKALRLGWFLLQSSFHKSHFSEDLFLKEIADLAGELKTTLFTAQMEPAEMKTENDNKNEHEDDAAIHQILLSIRQKWQNEVPAAKKEIIEKEKEPEPVNKEIEPAPEKSKDLAGEEELDKTVILSAEQLTIMMEKESQPAQDNRPLGKSAHTTEDNSNNEVELDKTVIMNLNDLPSLLHEDKKPVGAVQEQTAPPEPQTAVDQEDNLSETVIINLEELEKLKKL